MNDYKGNDTSSNDSEFDDGFTIDSKKNGDLNKPIIDKINVTKIDKIQSEIEINKKPTIKNKINSSNVV